MTQIPQHLAVHPWYAPHIAWLRAAGYEPRHDPGDAALARANLRWADLGGADLSGADLGGADLRGADLRWADLRGADLRWADLSGAELRGADLSGADLSGADLSGADLRGAIGLPPAPAIPNIDRLTLRSILSGGTLDMVGWHGDGGRCGTTHCRAGWAIHHAGIEGASLQHRFGPSAAGALIYAASYTDLPVPDFYASNEEALTDIRARAERTTP